MAKRAKFKKSRYPKQPAIEVDSGIVRFACCDCGLVHVAGVAVTPSGIVHMVARRDNRATAQLRRHRFGDLHNKDEKWKMVRIKK